MNPGYNKQRWPVPSCSLQPRFTVLKKCDFFHMFLVWNWDKSDKHNCQRIWNHRPRHRPRSDSKHSRTSKRGHRRQEDGDGHDVAPLVLRLLLPLQRIFHHHRGVRSGHQLLPEHRQHCQRVHHNFACLLSDCFHSQFETKSNFFSFLF